MGEVVIIANDSLENVKARLGTDRDKAASTSYVDSPIDHHQIIAAYRSSGIARKIVDIPALDASRNWRDWQAEKDQIEAIEAEEKRLGLKAKVIEARKKARLRGEAFIYFDLGDDAAKPLDAGKVRRGGIRFLNVLTPDQLSGADIEMDPLSEFFGWPKYYTVVGSGAGTTQIHPSRLMKFIGVPVIDGHGVDPRAGETRRGESVLVAMLKDIKQSDSAAANINSLIYEANVDVISAEGLSEWIKRPGGDREVAKRYRLAAEMKGNNGMLLLDGKETYDRKQITFGSLPDLMDRFDQRAAAVADIPMTRLFSRSPAGMNATGTSDMKNYFDRLKADQELEIGPAMALFDECLIRSATGDRDKDVYYTWAPLEQMSEKEQAEIFERTANAARTLAGKGGLEDPLLPLEAISEAVGNRLIEDNTLPGLEGALKRYATTSDPDADEDAAAAALGITTVAEERRRIAANDAAPRTLYVRRDVLNRAEIERWARSQGFTDIVPDLHVTIAYSRTPVDWFSVGTSWTERVEIAAGGPRQMAELGAAGEYKALLITANELVWRNKEMREAGASWDWPDYQPHISIAVGGNMPEDVEPYQGKIVLGPEIFEAVEF